MTSRHHLKLSLERENMYFGLDVHKKFIQVCCLSKDGKTHRSYQISGVRKDIEDFASSLKKGDEVVLETHG